MNFVNFCMFNVRFPVNNNMHSKRVNRNDKNPWKYLNLWTEANQPSLIESLELNKNIIFGDVYAIYDKWQVMKHFNTQTQSKKSFKKYTRRSYLFKQVMNRMNRYSCLYVFIMEWTNKSYLKNTTRINFLTRNISTIANGNKFTQKMWNNDTRWTTVNSK